MGGGGSEGELTQEACQVIKPASTPSPLAGATVWQTGGVGKWQRWRSVTGTREGGKWQRDDSE